MSSNASLETELELDDWVVSEDDEPELNPAKSLDSRRRVENKLEELRLMRETSEFQFDL